MVFSVKRSWLIQCKFSAVHGFTIHQSRKTKTEFDIKTKKNYNNINMLHINPI